MSIRNTIERIQSQALRRLKPKQHGLIGITVSTNYADILPFILQANLPHLHQWIFITDKNDKATIALLSQYPKVEVLFWDFQNEDRTFDKGGAMAKGQAHAFAKYPDYWYLNLDSDLCLPSDFDQFHLQLPLLDKEAIYGAKRRGFLKLSDYQKRGESFGDRVGDKQVQGYFQLYRKHILYEQSQDASVCDVRFADRFERDRQIILNLTADHLGPFAAHWQGRTDGSGFVIDC